jgi:hypothetical protein
MSACRCQGCGLASTTVPTVADAVWFLSPVPLTQVMRAACPGQWRWATTPSGVVGVTMVVACRGDCRVWFAVCPSAGETAWPLGVGRFGAVWGDDAWRQAPAVRAVLSAWALPAG